MTTRFQACIPFIIFPPTETRGAIEAVPGQIYDLAADVADELQRSGRGHIVNELVVENSNTPQAEFRRV